MKKIMLFVLSTILVVSVNAQNQRNLILVSGSQENFIAFIDQSRVNNQGMNEIAVTGMTDNYYNVSIRFANHYGQVFKANLYVPPMTEIVYEVYPADDSNPNGTYFIRDVYPVSGQVHVQNPYAVFPFGYSGYTQNQSSSNYNSNQNSQVNINIINNVGAQETQYGGGCNAPVSADRFEDMQRRVDNQMLSDDKLRIAKQIIKTNCITAYQLTQIMESFSFDDSRLELAKYAYDYIYDIGNFYKVSDALNFISNREELEEYVSERG